MIALPDGVQDIEHLPTQATRPKAPYTGVERRVRKPVLGMRIRDFDSGQSARYMLGTRRSAAEGVGLFVTPNIQHVALAREDGEFRTAVESAQIIVADGFPVFRFARLRGLSLPGRVAGREVIERMFEDPAPLAGHRGYFVVDTDETASLIEAWVARDIPGFACRTHVPPFGFDRDVAQCAALADEVTRFDTTLLFLCIGAPKSEVFVHRHRALLPPCWALCVGQSFRLMLGTTTPPPALMVRLNLEWLWRIMLEPRRMLRRYGPSTIGFLRAARADLTRR
ncbi:N-acetylglucosaminyldiphosphoundecaprenol N-acetyl-beta-D-mannosaminyltransferase [Sphingomonas insulae]|uniref:Glycosyltransferase n=1 Tax=Sphingomonas insulae TaxID=424800 RepID=A0ABN1HTJ0_9SPHN|nr:WecB/TagA/CpsF family glycosyltransferase [Sphingomonas insulae]NIJ28147.1 N-acetylglucosaminyldiphosphoundecaprenol N-acetyl-beta-D-mannosaminyltransferase [Sphingomonas insulae]